MLKRFHQLLSLLLLSVLCGSCIGPNTDPVLPSVRAAYIGQEYVLLEDCYLFKFTNDDQLRIGIHYKTPSFGAMGLPEIVDKMNIGKQFGDAIIVAIIPSGTNLRIKNIHQEISFEEGNMVWFICDLVINGKVEYGDVNTLFIQTAFDGNGSKPPVFNPETVKKK